MQLQNNYHECKIEVKAIMPGSLSSFVYAYCKTIGVPAQLEPQYIRKAVSYTKIAKHVRTHITNDFDGWVRANQESSAMLQVLSNIINAEDGRTKLYSQYAPANDMHQRMNDLLAKQRKLSAAIDTFTTGVYTGSVASL